MTDGNRALLCIQHVLVPGFQWRSQDVNFRIMNIPDMFQLSMHPKFPVRTTYTDLSIIQR